MRKNTWCPLIQDYCKGTICVCCVCYEDTTFSGEPVPQCTYLNAIINDDELEEEDDYW